ncbi:RagB/SusD family nutrient uptake outer membrane protein [Seonamhaeicola algicola]|uniref:RagB/SusD family nutrient uptake outer membrane protein n=1 Tax=Seonamhaeicola algicola TaxID=1719036 RepID=A0A5C7AJW7_9FLAO|nr:RagB/SusD family nutrient uptake outer membrane protein [Seonamhaeicola algicola]TXE06052.1 RagB/SusD family nutrient uptake outer membrane protein [Seonamhaeicola algicola]
MKNIYIRKIQILFGVLLLVSCSDILDETPDNRTTIDTPDKIAELLVAAYPEAAYVSFLEPMSDNAGDKGSSATVEFRVNEEMYFWRDLNDIDTDTPTNYWNEAYKAIAQANQALASIEELGDGIELSALKGEALLCRAYAHYMLVNIFSKAFNPSTSSSDLGIPYVLEPETVLLADYERGTVADVYANIQKDLEEGLPLIQDNYEIKAFHFTKKAASAFASRFYLTVGDWEKVIEHSNIALGDGNTLAVLRNIASSSNLTFNEQVALYTSSTVEPANLLLVTGSSLYNRIDARARYQMAPNIVNNLFNSANITGKGWAYSLFFRGGSDNNFIPKYQEYFRVTNQAAGIGIPFVTFVLFSTDEALLNRAEAYAMLGQYENATNDINMSLAVKTDGYNPSTDTLTPEDIAAIYQGVPTDLYTPFYTISNEALPFVSAVLDIKQTVFYNEGLRWFDVKRHNIAIEHLDFFGNSYELPKGDNRRAVQIPEAAQSFGVEANPR